MYSAGTAYASYAVKSEFHQNKISRLKIALTLLKKAVKMNPRTMHMFHTADLKALKLGNLGRVYLAMGNANKAEKFLVKSLIHKRDQPTVISLLAISQVLLGHSKEGYKIVEKGIKENPEIKRDTTGVSMILSII